MVKCNDRLYMILAVLLLEMASAPDSDSLHDRWRICLRTYANVGNTLFPSMKHFVSTTETKCFNEGNYYETH